MTHCSSYCHSQRVLQTCAHTYIVRTQVHIIIIYAYSTSIEITCLSYKYSIWCVCVCVCEREREGGREGGREGRREEGRERQRGKTSLAASMMVVIWERSPHSARKVSVKAWRNTGEVKGPRNFSRRRNGGVVVRPCSGS